MVAGDEVARIDAGLLLLAGFGRDDNAAVVQRAATRIVNLRVLADASGHFQYSVAERAGDVLLVPQFTLYADLSKGRRPDFTAALEPRQASVLFDALVHPLMRLVRAVLPQMIERKDGAIVAVTSAAPLKGLYTVKGPLATEQRP